VVKSKSRLGYRYGVGVQKDPYEAPLKTGAEKFQSIVGQEGAYYAVGSRFPRERKRMAGDVFNLELKLSTGIPAAIPEPKFGSAELRTPDLPQ